MKRLFVATLLSIFACATVSAQTKSDFHRMLMAIIAPCNPCGVSSDDVAPAIVAALDGRINVVAIRSTLKPSDQREWHYHE